MTQEVPWQLLDKLAVWYLLSLVISGAALLGRRLPPWVSFAVLCHQIVATAVLTVLFFHEIPITVWLLTIPLPVSWLIVVLRRVSKGFVPVSLVLSILVLVIGLASLFGEEDGFEGGVSRIRAERIMAAVEEYRQQHGTCPVLLADLVPDYLSHVPKPLVMRHAHDNFVYDRSDDGRSFDVWFYAGNGYYHRKTQQGWICPAE